MPSHTPRRVALALALTLASFGCGTRSESASSSTTAAAQDGGADTKGPATEEPATEERATKERARSQLRADAGALGERGSVMLALLDPDFAASAKPLLVAAGIEQVDSPLALLRALARMIDLELEGELAGRDVARPILVSLLEPPEVEQLGSTHAFMRAVPGPGLREQVLVPASDVSALADSLAASFAKLEPWPALVEGRPGARAWTRADGFVALLPEARALRVVVVHGVRALSPSRDLAAMQAQLVQVASTERGPAWREFTSDGSPVGALVRTEQLHALRWWLDFHEGLHALRDSPDGATAGHLARTLFSQLGMAALPSMRTPEFAAWAVSAGPTRLDAVASLSPAGVELFEEGRAHPTGARVIELAPLLLTAGEFTSVTDALRDLNLASQALDGCGSPCRIVEALRAPIHNLRMPPAISVTDGGVASLDMTLTESPNLFPPGMREQLPERPVLERIATLGKISLRARQRQDALSLAIAFGVEAQPFDPELSDAPVQARSQAERDADACFGKALGHSLEQLLAFIYGRADRVELLESLLASIEPDLRCAGSGPAARLRRELLAVAVDQRWEDGEFARAQALLDRVCAASNDPEICARRGEFQALPQPRVPVSAPASYCCDHIDRYGGDGLPIHVSAAGISVAGRKVATDSKAIASAISSTLLADSRTSFVLTLFVDAELEFAALHPVLDAAAALGATWLLVAILDERGDTERLPLALRWPKPFEHPFPAELKVPGAPTYSYVDSDAPPGAPALQLLRLDGEGMQLLGAEGRVLGEQTLATLDALEALNLPKIGQQPPTSLEVSDATKWGQVVELVGGLCPGGFAVGAPSW